VSSTGSNPVYQTIRLRDVEESGLSRIVWDDEYAGSNPAIPTKTEFKVSFVKMKNKI
jgi:hypothetical protein